MKYKITDEEYAQVLKELETAPDGYYRNMLVAVANRYNGKSDIWTRGELRLSSRQAVSRLICGFKENGLDYYKNAKNRLQCCYTFTEIFKDSTRYHTDIIGTDIAEAERVFTNVLIEASIPLDFFKAPTGKYRFNMAGRELAIDVLNNYKSGAYKQLRLQHYSDETAEKYAFLIGNAICNYHAICMDYPKEYLNLHEIFTSAVAMVFANIFKNTGSLDSCPGMSFLGGLPSEINQNGSIILDDIAYIDPIVYQHFIDEHENRDALREEWLMVISEILRYRIEKRDLISKLLESEDFAQVTECVDKFLSEISDSVHHKNLDSLSEERAWISLAKQNKKNRAAIIQSWLIEAYKLHQNPDEDPDQAAVFSKLRLLPLGVDPETLLNMILNPPEDETGAAQ